MVTQLAETGTMAIFTSIVQGEHRGLRVFAHVYLWSQLSTSLRETGNGSKIYLKMYSYLSGKVRSQERRVKVGQQPVVVHVRLVNPVSHRFRSRGAQASESTAIRAGQRRRGPGPGRPGTRANVEKRRVRGPRRPALEESPEDGFGRLRRSRVPRFSSSLVGRALGSGTGFLRRVWGRQELRQSRLGARDVDLGQDRWFVRGHVSLTNFRTNQKKRITNKLNRLWLNRNPRTKAMQWSIFLVDRIRETCEPNIRSLFTFAVHFWVESTEIKLWNWDCACVFRWIPSVIVWQLKCSLTVEGSIKRTTTISKK